MPPCFSSNDQGMIGIYIIRLQASLGSGAHRMLLAQTDI